MGKGKWQSPLRNSAGKIVTSNGEKLNLLNNTYIHKNTCLTSDGFPIGPTNITTSFTIQNFSGSDDVRKAVQSLPNKTSVGPDQISYRLLKEPAAGPGVVGPLKTLFNLSITLNKVPDEWKEAIVSPVFKGRLEDRQDLGSYRPISLTSCVVRTMEKLVNGQVLNYLSTNSLLYEHQSGFLPKHSTVTQRCYLSNQWQMALEKEEDIHAVFLDLSKAYDRVSIPGLLYKLSSLDFTDSTMQWFTSFLTNREQRMRVDGCLSLPQAPKSGIPQGTVLGPILFLVDINDRPRSIPSECSIFADDTSMFKMGRNSQLICSWLSEDLSRATDWTTVWGMLNEEKSEHLIISTKRNNTSQQRVLMDNTQIPPVTSHKHLGIHFSDTLSWQKHIDKVYTSCAQRVGTIRRLRWRFSPAVLKKIFIGTVQPKLEYAWAVWSGGSTQKLQKLCTSFSRQNGTALQPFTKKDLIIIFSSCSTRFSCNAPPYLTSLLPPLSLSSGYTFRKLSYRFPAVKRTLTMNSFLPRAVAFWNELPMDMQHSSSTFIFKKCFEHILNFKHALTSFQLSLSLSLTLVACFQF